MRVANLLLAILTASVALAHRDDGKTGRVGEYRLILRHLDIKTFDPSFFGDRKPDVVIKTHVAAEHHEIPAEWMSKMHLDYKIEDILPINSLIFWHMDCFPSQKLFMKVEVFDKDGSDNDDILSAIDGGVIYKLLQDVEPKIKVGEIIKKLTGSIISAIVGDSQPFTTWQSNKDGSLYSITPGVHKVTIPDPRPGKFSDASDRIGTYEFEFDFIYTVHEEDCSSHSTYMRLMNETLKERKMLHIVAQAIIGLQVEKGAEATKKTKEPTPSPQPTKEPTMKPYPEPTTDPTPVPTTEPTPAPVKEPSPEPTSNKPTPMHTTKDPTPVPVNEPTPVPITEPTPVPTHPTKVSSVPIYYDYRDLEEFEDYFEPQELNTSLTIRSSQEPQTRQAANITRDTTRELNPFRCAKILKRMHRATKHLTLKPLKVKCLNRGWSIKVVLPAEIAVLDPRRFYLLGAAAGALKKGKVILKDPLSVTKASAQRIIRIIYKNPENLKKNRSLKIVEAMTVRDRI